MVRIQVFFRSASGSKWSTKLLAILLALVALAAMLFIALGVWLVVSAVVVLITAGIAVRALLNRHRDVANLPSTGKDQRDRIAGRISLPKRTRRIHVFHAPHNK
jgi:uncharacterized membrane protein